MNSLLASQDALIKEDICLALVLYVISLVSTMPGFIKAEDFLRAFIYLCPYKAHPFIKAGASLYVYKVYNVYKVIIKLNFYDEP